MTSKEYMDVKHFVREYIWRRNEQYILKGHVKRQPTQKKVECFESSISNCFPMKGPSKKDDVQKKEFVKDLQLLIGKNNLPM